MQALHRNADLDRRHIDVTVSEELIRVEPGGPVFLPVWRQGNELFLQMRRNSGGKWS